MMFRFTIASCKSFLCLFCSCCLVLTGCPGQSTPSSALNPEGSANRALEVYDTNSDGKISKQEFDSGGRLWESIKSYDTDGDKSLSADEIATRLQAYSSLSDYIATEISLTSKNQPIAGATVVFTSESFMGDRSYSGTSDENGILYLDADPGLPLGFYNVEITRGDGKVDTLAVEVADDLPQANRMSFDLP